MKPGYTFAYVTCSKCGKKMPSNWYVRHLRANHPLQECQHCWHFDGTILTSNPVQYELLCCHCGKKAAIRVDPRLIDRDGEHGEHLDAETAGD